VIDQAEVAALRADAQSMLARAPTGPDAKLDAQGRPAFGLDYARLPYPFTKPLADPWGGTPALGGRHPAQMAQPTPDAGAPEHVVFLMYAMCQAMPSGLRLYGHPKLLAVAQSINGADFVPFNDAIFVKQPGLGGSVAWHQDGVTHWNSPDWDEGIHGFNFQVQLYPTTTGNCLWVMPGSHKRGPRRHQGHGERLRQRAAARRGAAGVRRRRCHHRQPADGARLVRQQLARPAHLADLRLPSP
jgi:hypothetical protein